ncbi:hypothetical protein D3C74_315000 [compost metagenome]
MSHKPQNIRRACRRRQSGFHIRLQQCPAEHRLSQHSFEERRTKLVIALNNAVSRRQRIFTARRLGIEHAVDEIIHDFDPVSMALQRKILHKPLHNLRHRNAFLADQVIFAVKPLQEHIVQPHPCLKRTLRLQIGQQSAQHSLLVLCVQTLIALLNFIEHRQLIVQRERQFALHTLSGQERVSKTRKVLQPAFRLLQCLPCQLCVRLLRIAKVCTLHPARCQIEYKVLLNVPVTGAERAFFHEGQMNIFAAFRLVRIGDHTQPAAEIIRQCPEKNLRQLYRAPGQLSDRNVQGYV